MLSNCPLVPTPLILTPSHLVSRRSLLRTSCVASDVPLSPGLRNVARPELGLKEAFRVLKKGGRFMCLEFSHVIQQLFVLFAILFLIFCVCFLPGR
jgi:hypothetical protein